MNWNKFTIKKQLIIALMLVGIVPFIVMGASSYFKAEEAVMKESYNKLEAVRDIKLKQLEQLFHFRKADLNVLASTTDIKNFIEDLARIDSKIGMDPMKSYPVQHPLVQQITKKYDAYFQKFMTTYKYYDVFLIDADDGHVVYSAARESDYGANLINGPLQDSGLGKVFKDVKSSKKTSLVDMAPYAPSNGEPAIFMGAPVFDKGKLTSVAVIQISDRAITGITSGRAGMGETGEVYLVGQDKLMRSDSFLDPQNHSLKASFANPAKGMVDTDAVKDALSGNTNTQIVMDYNGNPVLSAYTILDPSKQFNADFKWVILAEIDVAEVTIPTSELRTSAFVMGLVFLGVIILIALFIGSMISKPIFEAVRSITEANHQVVSASSEISDSATSLAEGASTQASSVEEVSATIEESTAINTQNSENSREADLLAKSTKESAEEGFQRGNELMSAMTDINSSSERISKIIKTIDEIASQTKLLALNAAVEAARAGEHGLGFAVVADEVKSLAQRSADAATETANIIEESIEQVKNGSDIASKTSEAFSDILERIKKTSDLIGEISISAKEQSEGMNQIASAMGQIDEVTQQNAATSEEAAAAAEELNAQAVSMQETVEIVGAMVGYGEESASSKRKEVKVKNRPIQKGVLPAKRSSLKKEETPNPDKKQASSTEEVFPLDEDDLKEF